MRLQRKVKPDKPTAPVVEQDSTKDPLVEEDLADDDILKDKRSPGLVAMVQMYFFSSTKLKIMFFVGCMLLGVVISALRDNHPATIRAAEKEAMKTQPKQPVVIPKVETVPEVEPVITAEQHTAPEEVEEDTEDKSDSLEEVPAAAEPEEQPAEEEHEEVPQAEPEQHKPKRASNDVSTAKARWDSVKQHSKCFGPGIVPGGIVSGLELYTSLPEFDPSPPPAPVEEEQHVETTAAVADLDEEEHAEFPQVPEEEPEEEPEAEEAKSAAAATFTLDKEETEGEENDGEAHGDEAAHEEAAPHEEAGAETSEEPDEEHTEAAPEEAENPMLARLHELRRQRMESRFGNRGSFGRRLLKVRGKAEEPRAVRKQEEARPGAVDHARSAGGGTFEALKAWEARSSPASGHATDTRILQLAANITSYDSYCQFNSQECTKASAKEMAGLLRMNAEAVGNLGTSGQTADMMRITKQLAELQSNTRIHMNQTQLESVGGPGAFGKCAIVGRGEFNSEGNRFDSSVSRFASTIDSHDTMIYCSSKTSKCIFSSFVSAGVKKLEVDSKAWDDAQRTARSMHAVLAQDDELAAGVLGWGAADATPTASFLNFLVLLRSGLCEQLDIYGESERPNHWLKLVGSSHIVSEPGPTLADKQLAITLQQERYVYRLFSHALHGRTCFFN